MANKHKSKHKKEKSKKLKKHKKEKKVRSDSSNLEEIQKKEIQEPVKREEWNFFETILSSSNVSNKHKEKGAEKPSPEKLGQNVRELNPYWKNGGCGLPPNYSSDSFKDRISSSRISDQGSDSKNYSPNIQSRKSKLGFLKPDEDSNINVRTNAPQKNWKKKGTGEFEGENKKKEVMEESSPKENSSSNSKPLSNEELNKLAAKLMKAEMMGNTDLVSKLKAELDAAKKFREETSNKQMKKEDKEIVLVEKSMKKSYEGKQSYLSSKRQKVNTHDSQGRVCYFPNDDKYSIKSLFEKEKAGLEEQIFIPISKAAEKSPEELDDIYLEAAASYKMQKKLEEKQHQKIIKEATFKHKTLKNCKFCINNKTKHLIISTGKNCYLCLPEEQSLVPNHCFIVPLQHEISTLHLDEDVWGEIKTYQKVLTKMFLEQDQDVIFFENARSFKYHPHCFIQCVPLEKEIGDLAPIYFQKAISESETEWSSNKKVVDFRNKDLRRSIPKGLPYFAVSFGTEGGFAHVIEDEQLFKRNFAEEVIGGMMDLDHKKWRKPQPEDFRNQRQKALEFLKIWKKYEFNEDLACTDSSSSE